MDLTYLEQDALQEEVKLLPYAMPDIMKTHSQLKVSRTCELGASVNLRGKSQSVSTPVAQRSNFKGRRRIQNQELR